MKKFLKAIQCPIGTGKMEILYTLLVSIVWFLSTYFVIVFILSLFYYKDTLYTSPSEKQQEQLPKVSIIVPAHNEEKDIAATIESLKILDYPKELVEIIVVNDGSTDRTCEVVQLYAEKKDVFFIDNPQHKGKAACLNQGLDAATGAFVVCMDADTIAEKDVLRKTVVYFDNLTVGAVTVPVEVKDPQNLLEKVVDIEYIIGLSLFIKIFSYFDAVQVTPGPFSIYRMSLLREELGGFDKTNITEDLEIAYRIHKAGYKIECCMTTKVRTVIPCTIKTLYRQRKRWYSGAILTAIKHRDMLLRTKYGLFSFFVPFNFAIISLGLLLFLYSNYLFLHTIVTNISLYALTNYNFFAYFSWSEIDLLKVNILSFFGLSSILLTIFIFIIGMRYARKTLKKRLISSVGFVFFFFFYQFFWFMSFYSVLVKRKIKW